MAYNPGDQFVTPTGIEFFKRMFGETREGNPTGEPTWFGDDPFTDFRRSYDMQRLGGGVLDATPELQWARQGSTNRFVGDGTMNPESGLPNGGWADRWQQWFGTDVTGPDGNVLLSPQHMTGLRVGQDYGVERDPYGNVTDPWHSSMFQSSLGIRNNLNSDVWLDPLNATGGLRNLAASSPYAMPQAGDYLSTMRDAVGGPGAADFYGQRGVDQTNALADTNLRQLTRGIDREAQNTLGMQLPEIQNAMEAAGLGRSGAGQMQLQQTLQEVMSQANRDKQRVMADYTDREANRQAQAINLGSQIGAQGYGQYSEQMGGAALAGLGDMFSANQANRQNEQALWAQQMGQRFQKNQGDQNALFQMLAQSGQFGLGQLDAERMGQSAALSDYMNLVNQREQWRGNSLNEMLALSDRERAIEQERLNQQLSTTMMPFDVMLRIMTGTTTPSQTRYGSPNPWMSAAAGFGGDIAGNLGGKIIDNWWEGGGQNVAG